MTTGHDEKALDRGGVALGVGAYALWGLFPAFWPLLDPAAPLEVLAHRILWTTVLMTVVLTLLRGWAPLRGLGLRGWLTVAAAAVFIAVNWGLFIYGVSVDLVVEAALGYYMTPLVSVLLGVLVLRERLGVLQWTALALGAAAVLVISIGNGTVPWLSMVLAASFGLYGLIKATVPLPATTSLTAEGIVLFPLAGIYILVLQLTGDGTFVGLGPWHLLLMLSAGPATALPLLLYGMSARRIPLSVLGVLMYLNPTLQFLWGVLVVGQDMPPARWVGFGLIWVALAVFTVDLLRRTRRSDGQPVRSTV
ncbi:chloramphenicol-sensitive protein RarD [Pseudonocardia sediminis]|uniref:Chloramphenicol-sensitive protein RarD n=1 Tax=Pseudonocardia sediminis TaxID=1397368 RepID=A0A4Q7V4S6_PSEST|nr:EamA family transporter RarD [Pseudonocardia sediminis]RZT88484.1 chloramphenicol-sensitive protein RarD [Pseudonocardia sediminis]